jgi:hypothetical protein
MRRLLPRASSARSRSVRHRRDFRSSGSFVLACSYWSLNANSQTHRPASVRPPAGVGSASEQRRDVPLPRQRYRAALFRGDVRTPAAATAPCR